MILEGANGFTLDYNDYYSPSGLIGKYNNTNYSDINSWQNNVGNDPHSFSVNPFLNGVHLNQALLNNAGTPIANVIYDIDNSQRNILEPDLGAKEYNPCSPDAGINEITSPANSISGGTHDVKVILQNQGSSELTSVQINWSVNNELQSPFSWSGSLDLKQNIEVNIGSFNFEDGIYSISAWTSNPNSAQECDHYNDTSFKTLATPLCGAYTIGGTNPDFSSFTQAVNVLNTAGISCPVVFNVRDGIYYEEFIMNDIPGSSDINTITFQSESGDSTAAMVYSNFNSNTVNLRNVNNIRFSKLGFSSSQWINLIHISQHCYNITIENCYFPESYTTAIYVYGSPTDTIRNINIIDNRIATANNSISLNYTSGSTVEGNNISNTQYGLTVGSSSNTIINGNRISGKAGIYISYSKTSSVYNNHVITTGSQQSTAIYASNLIDSEIAYNTVDIRNTDLGQESVSFRLEGTNSIEVKNNIFNVSTAGYPMVIMEGTNGFNLDYNDYYSPSGLIGKYNNTNYTDINSWGAAVNGDANSMAIPPMFAGDDDPLPYQRDFNGAAIPVGGVLLDINGNIRNDKAPDVGCVEFMIDFGVVDLVNPTLECFHSPQDSVTVFLRQFGDLPFQNLKISYQLNNGPVYTETIEGSIYNDLIYTFETPVNISPEGEYTFKVWLLNTRDDNLNNDTLIVKRYTKPAPVLDFTYNNECTGREVTFNGTASVAAPYFIASYEWIFDDGVTSYDQNPVHEFPVTGTHTVTFRAYSDAGCYNEKVKQINIANYEKLNLTLNVTDESCSDQCNGEIEIVITGGEAPLNTWLNELPISQSLITDQCAGEYTFRVQDSKGCETQSTATITTLNHYTTGINADPIQGFAPLMVNLDAMPVEEGTYKWFLNDAEIDDTAHTQVVLSEPRVHTIVLLTTTGVPNNCTYYDTLQITVEFFVDIFIPSAFTPNNDGYNDTFGPVTEGIRDLEMIIKDRNGRTVHEITETGGRWDGLMPSGDVAPQGTYFYRMDATGYDQKAYSRQGTVALYRDMLDMTPNPVKSIGKIDFTANLTGNKELILSSASGEIIRRWSTEENILEYDFSYLKPGLYFLRITSREQVLSVKFIKE